MKKFFLFLIFFSSPAFSHDDCGHDHGLEVDPSMSKLLERFSLDMGDLDNSPCKTTTVPTNQELEAFILNKSNGPKINETINGVKLEGESQALVDAFKDFTTMHDQYSVGPLPEKQIAIQDQFKINPACSKVLCAMEKIWGKSLAQKMLYIKLKHNYNTSELAFDESSRFTENEIDLVILGLDDLPKEAIPVPTKSKRLTRYTRGKNHPIYGDNFKVVANAIIMLFDNWETAGPKTKQYTIFHEVSHNIATKYDNFDNSQEWLDKSGWIKYGENWKRTKNSCITSQYGGENPLEDFAESLTAYRYNGKKFKTQCPEKYELLKTKVFKGKEYYSKGSCSGLANSLSGQQKKDLINNLKKNASENPSIKEVYGNCKDQFSKYPLNDSELRSCSISLQVNKLKINEQEKDELVEELENNYPNELKSVDKRIGKMIIDDLEESYREVNPKEDDIKLVKALSEIKDNRATRSCARKWLNKEVTDFSTCMIEDLIDQDRAWQSHGSGMFPTFRRPRYFTAETYTELQGEREKILRDHVKNFSSFQEKVAQFKAEIKQGLLEQNSLISQKIGTIENWQDQTPESFCEKTYGTLHSDTILKSYSIYRYDRLKGLKRLCVDKQKESDKRYLFDDSTWVELVNNVLR